MLDRIGTLPAVFDFPMVGSEKGPSGSWAALQTSFKTTVTALKLMCQERLNQNLSGYCPRAL